MDIDVTVANCGTGSEGVFLLHAPDGGKIWSISGKEITASTLGDFSSMPHYRIDDSTGTLYAMPWNRDWGITVEDLR